MVNRRWKGVVVAAAAVVVDFPRVRKRAGIVDSVGTDNCCHWAEMEEQEQVVDYYYYFQSLVVRTFDRDTGMKIHLGEC